eukprot:COSAG03_NODE_18514_length_353_cov_1.078740_1_plen_49_part_10
MPARWHMYACSDGGHKALCPPSQLDRRRKFLNNNHLIHLDWISLGTIPG